jgi:hypothetical protein
MGYHVDDRLNALRTYEGDPAIGGYAGYMGCSACPLKVEVLEVSGGASVSMDVAFYPQKSIKLTDSMIVAY